MSSRWWEQAGIDLEGAKKMAAEEATVLESELDLYTDPGGEEESSGASGLSGVCRVGRKSDPLE